MSLLVNRADLAWALNAVLPHVGSKAENLDYVGFSLTYSLKLYATDKYTAGVAGIAVADIDFESSEPVEFALPKKEAKDLLQMVRPTLKRHESEQVELLLADSELHIALEASEDGGERETAVFETVSPEMDYDRVSGRIRAVWGADEEDLSQHPELPFKPDFAARFAKAQRYETDRLILSPRMIDGLEYGASYVTVGDHFVGAIAGLTYSAPEWVQEENAA